VIAVIVSANGVPAVLREPGTPVTTLPYPESAARALALAVERSTWLRRPHEPPAAAVGIDRNAARAVVESALSRDADAWLEPAQVRSLLEAYGVPLVGERLATTADEAAAAAAALGYPAVVKTALPGLHKTDVGGVALDLRDEPELRAAVDRIGTPVLVQPLLERRIELLAGIVQDPVFGPIVAFGPGGQLAELIGDAAFRLTPLTGRDAEELVTSGKAGRLVAGFRGAAAADRSALVELLVRLSCLADDLPEVAELDLNPVLANADGCVVVDARVRVRATSSPRPLKSW
jgi:acyl-CoA synthetase (NDP forming)